MSDKATNSIWLAEFPVRSILGVEKGQRLHFTLAGRTEVYLEDPLDANSTGDKVLRIVFGAADVDEAKKMSRERAEEAIALITFCTQTPFRLLDQTYLLEWTPGLPERELVLFFYEPKAGEIGVLEQPIFGSAGVFSEHASSDVSKRALHWYAAGVRAELAQDQFQYFWFSIEQIVGTFSGEKRTDRCARCDTELHCPTCHGPSKHKPFPSQKIRQFLGMIGVPEKVVDGLLKFRNAMMHGADNAHLNQLAAKLGAAEGISQIVDATGEAAWRAISHLLQVDEEGRKKIQLGGIDTYVSKRMVTSLHGTGQFVSDPNSPKFEEIALPKVEASILGRDPDGKEFSTPLESSGLRKRPS